MELNNFLAHIKANKCRITKGKEELFYNAIKKYGYEGPHV
jgi:ribosomal protein L10